jgi:PAS domain S-box-containing protein
MIVTYSYIMQRKPRQTIRILHVDDDPDFADLTQTFLERESDRFVVETASSADEGLQTINHRPPDCVVSDYNMPGTDGIEFLQAVQEDHPDLPFILFTGKGSEDIASDAISAGVTDYLQKQTITEQYEILANRIQNVVTARRDAEEATRQQDLMERAEVLGSTGGWELWVESEDLRLTDGLKRIYGVETDRIPSLDEVIEFYEPDSQRRIREVIDEAIEDGYAESDCLRLRTTGGEHRIVEGNAELVGSDEDGTLLRGVIQDITDRRERQRELSRLQQAIDDATVPITLADPSQTNQPLVYVNDAFGEMTGYPPEETLGRNCRFLQGEDTDPETVATLREAIDNEEPVTVELRNYRKDGTEFWNRVTVTPIYDDGELVRYLGTQEDVTERKEREKRLTELNQATQALMTADTRQAAADIGVEAASGILGFEANAIHFSSADDTELVPVAHTEKVIALAGNTTVLPVANSIAGRVYRNGNPETVEDVQQDPDTHDPTTSLRSYLYLPLADHGILIAGARERGAFDQQDLTLGELLVENLVAALDRIDRKQELRQMKNQYQTLVENFPDGAVFLYDSDLTYIRARGEELNEIDLSPGDFIGKNPHALFPEETADELCYYLQEALDGNANTFEHEYGGERYRLRAVPVQTDDEETDYVMGVSQNITEEAENRKRLERKNERLEEFTGIVSHDLRNPLRVATGRLELIQQECESDHIDDVVQALDRMDALIEDLLTLAQEGEQVNEVGPVELGSEVKNSWQTVNTEQARLKHNIFRSVEADESRLRQLFENLYRNAVEHGDDDVTVSVGAMDDGFYVADTGPGIPESDREKVFKPGYSTNKNGTGFGLCIVKRVVDAHGWEITITESEKGGARFEITGVENGK